MKKTASVVLITIVITAVICFAYTVYASDNPKFTKHFNESLFNITDKGLFSVEILMDDGEYPKLGKDVIGLVIHNQYDKDVEGAIIQIKVIPEGTAGSIAPAIKERGDGLYTVSNINLKKSGKWKLSIDVKKAEFDDSASFLFPDVLHTPLHKGKYSAD